MSIKITDEQLDAVLAALDGYEAYRCTFHNDGDHGDESECEGWGPTGIADLIAGDHALRLVKQERRLEVQS